MEKFLVQERKFRDLEDASAKLPCNLKAMADFMLDRTQPEQDRIDFMYTLCGQKHPAIKFLLNTIAIRDEGLISAEAYKILKSYDSGPDFRSYNNYDEALGELPKILQDAANRIIRKDLNKHEFYSLTELLLTSKHPAAVYIIEKTGAGKIGHFQKFESER